MVSFHYWLFELLPNADYPFEWQHITVCRGSWSWAKELEVEKRWEIAQANGRGRKKGQAKNGDKKH
jgi:hypothetical protein